MAKRQNWAWSEEDGEELLWVCQYCGAECNADFVGEECPACGEKTEEDSTL